MKNIRLILLLILSAMAIWVGIYPSQAAVPNPEGTSRTGSIQASSTPTAVPSLVLTTKTPTATKTPQPAISPVPTPPPADPNTTQFIVLFGVLLFAVVLVGMGINRRQIF